MLSRFAQWFEGQIGTSARTETGRALVVQRFSALKRQAPLLYGMLFACLLGFHLTLSKTVAVPDAPVAIALAVIALRSMYWLRFRSEKMTASTIRREMRKTFFITAAFCFGCLVWSVILYQQLGPNYRIIIASFATLVALGCCCGLNSFPATARIPVLVLALPFAAILTVSSEPGHAGLGISFIILSVLALRLLHEQDLLFRVLVSSRFSIEQEKTRAITAEKSAVAEQVRVGIIADTDSLTGLANRRGFLKALVQLAVNDGRKLSLILLDLDGFKPVNDTFGHATGDAMLIEVGGRLKRLDLSPGCVARLGGDEFALIYECADEDAALAVARAAVATLSKPFWIGSRRTIVSCCAGLSFQPAEQLSEAVRRADLALYAAKRRSRGSVAIFSTDMQEEVERRTSIEQALREPGLAENIDLAFQPIFDLKSMELKSFEALARWRHSELGWIPPSEFIPITEQLNVVQEISEALLKRAARVARQWPKSVQLSFNLSGVQLSSAETDSNVLRILAEEGIEPSRLQVEVTETALLSDYALARSSLSRLRRMGVRIVLDDLGAGYSSISYLREMHFDALKLDGSLMTAATETASGLALLRGVLALGRAMGQECVAEHIETDEQKELLIGLGCRYGHGFRLSRPISASAATRLALGLRAAAA